MTFYKVVNGERVPLSPEEEAALVEAWSAPPPHEDILTKRQNMTVERWSFASAAMAAGVINAEEAESWGPGNALPASVEAALSDAISDPKALAMAKVRARAAPRINRLNPLVEALRERLNLTPEQADDLFAVAKALEAE